MSVHITKRVIAFLCILIALLAAVMFLKLESELIDIMNLDPEKVRTITVTRAETEGAELDRKLSPVDPGDDIAYLIGELNQIEVRKVGKSGTFFDYTIMIYVSNGPDDAHTSIEDGWNPICISGNSICYDGVAYEVVSGDLKAVTSRLDELISGGKYGKASSNNYGGTSNMKVELFPLDRVEIDGVSISLGMDRSDVEVAMGVGKEQRVRNCNYYHCSDIAISFDEENKVDFIQVSGDIDGHIEAVIYGVSVFDVGADELAELLTRMNGNEIHDKEKGYSHSFTNISVGVYREFLPEGIARMIEEMKADGIPTENNPDLEADKWKAEHWCAIGIGVPGYYHTR